MLESFIGIDVHKLWQMKVCVKSKASSISPGSQGHDTRFEEFI